LLNRGQDLFRVHRLRRGGFDTQPRKSLGDRHQIAGPEQAGYLLADLRP